MIRPREVLILLPPPMTMGLFCLRLNIHQINYCIKYSINYSLIDAFMTEMGPLNNIVSLVCHTRYHLFYLIVDAQIKYVFLCFTVSIILDKYFYCRQEQWMLWTFTHWRRLPKLILFTGHVKHFVEISVRKCSELLMQRVHIRV